MAVADAATSAAATAVRFLLALLIRLGATAH